MMGTGRGRGGDRDRKTDNKAVDTASLRMGTVRVKENDGGIGGGEGRAWGRQRQRETDSKAVDTVGLWMGMVRVRENDGDRGRGGRGADRDKEKQIAMLLIQLACGRDGSG